MSEWSIKDVARAAGVTSRALRHYHQVGLLPPARVGANGYRYYGRDELLRLQQILLLRTLGLGLPAISDVLDGRHAQVDALRAHHRRLLDERDRYDRLARTVALTLEKLHRGEDFTPETLFDGFVTERREELRHALVERYGEGVNRYFDEAARRTAGWNESDYLGQRDQAEAIEERLLSLLRRGVSPDSADVLDIVAEHFTAVCHFWTPDRSSYRALGELYVDDSAQRERLVAQHPDLPEFLRDAIAVYAARRL